MNLYDYVENNPINNKDILGLAPGDLFNSIDGAAMDALQYIRAKPDSGSVEYGGFIKRTNDGFFTYKEPNRGDENSVDPGKKCRGDVANFHNHPKDLGKMGLVGNLLKALGASSDQFSGEDRLTGKGGPENDIDSYKTWNIPGFLLTPSGNWKVYTPNDGNIHELGPLPP